MLLKISGINLDFALKRQNNNYNLIRLLAAITVIVFHAFYLFKGNQKDNMDTPLTQVWMASGSLAVYVFFFLSGIFITASFINAQKFIAEERTGKLASVFAVLAIFISCLGLFGVASFVAAQRIKEIGIRKVLGASVVSIWVILSKDFVILVGIALLVSGPVSWYFMHQWLQHYTYHTALTWWVFVLTGAGAVLITLLTVSYHSIKAAMTNPVKSLRSE